MMKEFKPPVEAIVAAMREGLRGSPDNIQVRREIAETFLKHDRPEEAEKEFRKALARVPEDPTIKAGLALALLLHAQLLLKNGELDKSVKQYKKAIELDPSLSVPELSKQLAIK